MSKPLPAALAQAAVIAPGDTRQADITGAMPWYQGYSDAGRSVVAVCPYPPGSQAASLWHAGAATFRMDQRTPVRRPRWTLSLR